MSRRKIKIFDLNYLLNEEYTEDDLFLLFETKSLLYSLIYGMFKFVNKNISNDEIKKIIKRKNWVYKNYWTEKQCKEFQNKLINIYKRIYYVSDYIATVKTQSFIIQYGLTNINVKNNPNYIL